MHKFRRLYRRQGQSFVEMAVILPLILLVFFGMVEVGFAAHSYLIVTNASREGARFGSRGVHVPTDEISTVVETALENGLDIIYDGADANTTIIITQIDIDENGTYEGEAEVITNSKKIIPVSISASITIIEGKPLIQGIFRNITKQKLMKEELKN